MRGAHACVISAHPLHRFSLSGGPLLGCYNATLINECLQLITLQRCAVWTTVQVPDTFCSTPVRVSRRGREFSGLLTRGK
jgi:hypothetical protein